MLDYPLGATPLDPEEVNGLKPLHIKTQNELNEFEQSNILKAEQWIFTKRLSMEKVLEQDFFKELHKRMFDETWRWAGKYRLTEKNIGVDPVKISIEIKKLIDDVDYQLDNQTYSRDEIATRFHHRLVAIHPFANGNGRHARLMTDVFLKTLNLPLFTWGAKNLTDQNSTRQHYIKALQEADKHDYLKLLEFVRM